MSAPKASVPETAKPYKRTPDFTEHTVPDGLLKDHATKAGVWGVITVVSGQLRYVVPSTGVDEVLDATTPGIITPQETHRVEPIGEVTFFVEFWK